MLSYRNDTGIGVLAGRRAGVVRGALSLLLAAVLIAAGVFGALAHAGDDHRLDKFHFGQVTGKSDRSVRIDGREYVLHHKVVIQDDEGRPKQLRDFTTDRYVRYQLKDDRVKELILVTPK